ncbi:unnamed protein product [Urochloa humidicola]
MEGRLKGGGSSRLPPPAPPAEPGRAGRPATTAQQQQVKVKHIVTRKVSTDQANFKDVVQRLTGKDSAAARVAVVAAGADDAGTSWSSGATASGGSGVSSGAAVAFEIENNVAGTMLPSSEEDMRRWWHDP